jgi:predicted helicase
MLDGIKLEGSMQNNSERLKAVRTFPQLVKYLRDELDWPVSTDDFERLTFIYEPEELGIDLKVAVKIQEIRRLRPLTANQPWGIFFVKFEPKKLPVVALRRLLNSVALKRRATAEGAEKVTWATEDLLFISNYGVEDNRQITFAQFTQSESKKELPTLKVLGWDNLDTTLHLNHVAESLSTYLSWPEDENDTSTWRSTWRSAFSIKHREVVDTSKKLSIQLAGLARAIRDRINTVLEYETENGPITKLMNAFKEALVHDLDNDGFADMYAQTIAYGLLSARITNPSNKSTDDFASAMPITNPFLKELMETFIDVGGQESTKTKPVRLDFDELGVSEVVDLLDSANMGAVVRDFGDKNPLEDPVTHFYEQFFADYDNSERFRRGVFYTPRPVVSFIVRSVDEMLRDEFDLKYGLADTTTWGEIEKRIDNLAIPETITADHAFVQILDPATGTGTFLVEVIDLIHKTMVDKWQREGYDSKKIEQSWNAYVPEHLLPRLHGYEIMMAPYAIAHMKIGLKLYETGYNFDSDERARVYLTNALESAQDFSGTMSFAIPALAHEAEAVNSIKRNQRFTVVIGNPPYSGLSANMSGELANMIEPYKYVNGIHFGERKHWLHDDYVKFTRLAQNMIDTTRTGILGFITNHGFLDNPTFRGMRWNLLSSFNKAWLLDLHGNTMRRELNPQGGVDKNVFDIQQGVSISLFSKVPNLTGHSIRFGELWGTREDKYGRLISQSAHQACPVAIEPKPKFYLFIHDSNEYSDEYHKWIPINEIFNVFAGGFITARDHFVIDTDRDELRKRIDLFANMSISDDDLREAYFKGMGSKKYPDGDSRGWKLPDARKSMLDEQNRNSKIKRCLYRPFDFRWVFWADWMVDWPRPEVNGHLLNEGNIGLCFMRQVASGDAYSHFIVSKIPADNRACYSNKGIMSLAPIYLHSEVMGTIQRQSNFSRKWRELISVLAIPASEELSCEEQQLHYIYAVMHSPIYRTRYESILKRDYPRIPIVTDLECFKRLCSLGQDLVSLHLLEVDQHIDSKIQIVGGQSLEIEKASYSRGTVWVDKNQTKGFSGVPEEVWNFTLGGYQVCEKWLKDRQAKGGKNPRPGRVLTENDINHYQKIVVAISETIRIMGEIDEVIEAHGGWPGAFQSN